MKKIIVYTLACIALFGCSKVTKESMPCDGFKMPKPAVDSVIVIPPGSSGTVYAFSTGSTSYIWTSPTGTTTNSQWLNIDGSSGNPYGTYTVRAQGAGCISDPATFQVVDQVTIPCMPLGYTNAYRKNNTSWLSFSYHLSGGYSYYYNKYNIYGNDNNGYQVSVFIPSSQSQLLPGTVYAIDPQGTASTGGAVMEIQAPNGDVYNANSGNLYIYGSSYNESLVLCGVNFVGPNYVNYSVTGTAQFY